MNIKWMLKRYMAQLHIHSFGEVSKMTGIKYETLCDHIKNPQKLRLFEIKAIIKALGISQEDILKLILEDES